MEMSFVLRRILKKRNPDLLKYTVSPPKMSLFVDHLCLSVESCLPLSLGLVSCLFIAQPVQHSLRRHYLSSYNAHWGQESKKTEATTFIWEAFSLVLIEKSNHVPWVHTAMEQPRKPRSGTLCQSAERKTNSSLQIHE